jgi:hypothetical protein
MKRWLLAMAVLFGGATAVVHADYVIIRLNLAVTQDPEAEKAPQGGMAGMGMGGMMSGMGGRGMGAMGPGMGGQGQGQGQGMGGRGMGAMGPGMGGQGMGAMGPGMGGQGMGQGMGGRGMGAMGPGMGGQGQGQGMGGMMGKGGMGMGMGGQGQGMMMPGMGKGGMGTLMTQPGSEDEEDSTPLMITIIVEVDHKNIIYNKNFGRHHIIHKWGMTYLPYKGPGFDYTIIDKLDTVARRYDNEKRSIKEDDPNRADKLLELAQKALSFGLLDKVPELMAEVAKLEPKNPAVVAFQKTLANMNRKITVDDPAIAWQKKLEFNVYRGDHYAVLYESKIPLAQAKNWEERLEQNYRGFFYWFALKGRTLPVPTQKLVAVLVKDKEVFDHEQKEVFDNADMVADGFYSRRDNLAVFAAKPIDDGYASLEELSQKTGYKSLDRGELLRGEKSLSKKDKRSGVNRFDDKALYETYALIFQAKEAESEIATVSHEGTRQLIAAVGLLPRNVEVPQWFDFGVGSFFETPKGSFWAGVGGTNVPYQWNLKRWKSSKSKYWEKNALEALKAVVTDRYFREAGTSKKKEAELNRARTMSWALTYYLAQQKLDDLVRYYQELASLPRDMQLDEESMLGLFARAFGLVDVNKPDQLDAARAADFARKWYAYLEAMPPELIEAYKEATKEPTPQQKKTPPTNPGSGPAQ